MTKFGIQTSVFDSFDSYWSLNYKKSVTRDGEKSLSPGLQHLTAFQKRDEP